MLLEYFIPLKLFFTDLVIISNNLFLNAFDFVFKNNLLLVLQMVLPLIGILGIILLQKVLKNSTKVA